MPRPPRGFEASSLSEGEGAPVREVAEDALIEETRIHESVTGREARAIMGEDMFGRKEIEDTFGVVWVEGKEVPPVPFSRAELERAKELGHQLILYTDVAMIDGGSAPITIKALAGQLGLEDSKALKHRNLFGAAFMRLPFAEEETPRAGWRLVAPTKVPGSIGKNALNQTKNVIDELAHVYGDEIPRRYSKPWSNIGQFQFLNEDLRRGDAKFFASRISKLPLVQMTRETAVEAVYRMILQDQVSKMQPQHGFASTITSYEHDGVTAFIAVGPGMQGASTSLINITSVRMTDMRSEVGAILSQGV